MMPCIIFLWFSNQVGLVTFELHLREHEAKYENYFTSNRLSGNYKFMLFDYGFDYQNEFMSIFFLGINTFCLAIEIWSINHIVVIPNGTFYNENIWLRKMLEKQEQMFMLRELFGTRCEYHFNVVKQEQCFWNLLHPKVPFNTHFINLWLAAHVIRQKKYTKSGNKSFFEM